MKQILKDIIGFTKSLTGIDILLYFAVLILIILVVSLIYIIRTSDEETDDEEGPPEEGSIVFNKEDVDIKEIITNIENADSKVAEFTDYESEQEEKAIISYEELLAKNKAGELNYAEEKVVNNEVSVKKINIEPRVNTNNKEEKKKENSLFNYEKEEAFLKALKSLNELLN